MSKIFRISGYLVTENWYSKEEIESNYYRDCDYFGYGKQWQQLHIEESESFKLDGEEVENCDLALLTRHFKKDNYDMQFDRPLPVKGQKYRHFKLGKVVTIVGISRHTETEEVTVVYEYEGMIWNRPLKMFMSEVERLVYPYAKQKYRFELVEEGEK